MKRNLLIFLTAGCLALIPTVTFGQAPTMGTTADFVLFSSDGAVSNTGITHLTGNVGTNNGSSTGFGNVNGQMHDNDVVSGQASTDLLLLYAELDAEIATLFPGSLLGNGATLVPGVYSIPSAASLNLDLILDGQGNPNAIFIFQIDGAFATNANSKVKLINNAQACNVFWKVEGQIDMASGTTMRGTVIANNAAILMNVGDTLEGRALSIAGAVTVDGVFAYTPIGCGSPVLTGPTAPDLLSTECYGIFSGDGPVTNIGITYVTGDVGTNVGLTSGFDPLNMAGTLHPIPDVSTAAAASDLLTVYNYLNLLPYDIELLYPAQFGNNLVLTPHTYIMNGGVTFTDTLYLNAMGDPNAVFVIQVYGAFSTSTNSKVILINGAQSKNVYWQIDGAVEINDYSVFRGTMVCNNGAIDLLTGVTLDGRAMTTTGALNTSVISANMPAGCSTQYPPTIVSQPINDTTCFGQIGSFSVIAIGSGLTYQWRKGSINLVNGGAISGATSPKLTINPTASPDIGTDYNVVVSGLVSPNDTSTNAALVVCDDSGFRDSENTKFITIYPNPFSTSVTIALNNSVLTNTTLELHVYDVLGKEMVMTFLINNITLVEMGDFPTGTYFYKIISQDKTIQTGKLVSIN